jgi:hypothetical protein
MGEVQKDYQDGSTRDIDPPQPEFAAESRFFNNESEEPAARSAEPIPADPRWEKADLLNALRGLWNVPQDIRLDIRVSKENGNPPNQFAIRNIRRYTIIDMDLSEAKIVTATVQETRSKSTELMICTDWTRAQLRRETSQALNEPDDPANRIVARDAKGELRLDWRIDEGRTYTLLWEPPTPRDPQEARSEATPAREPCSTMFGADDEVIEVTPDGKPITGRTAQSI